MSAPKIIVQIVIIGGRIFGKALLEAGRQAVKNAKHRPAITSSDAVGVNNATSQSLTDRLTREHRMTLDEARMILNVRPQDSMDILAQRFDLLVKANSLRPLTESGPSGRGTSSHTSHYLLSKVVKARERLQAEVQVAEEVSASSPPSAGPPP